MRAIIEKIDSFGDETTFVIVGKDEDDIDNAVYELQQFARRDSTYPSARFYVKEYLP